jgi:hypothetical protein
MWNSFNHHRHSAENTKEREKIYEKIKRKKKLGSLSLSLSLSLPRARARASVRFSLAHIAYRGFSFTFTLRRSLHSFFPIIASIPDAKTNARRSAKRNEREREKRDTKKNTREREHHAHTDCFISEFGSARATSRALVQPKAGFCNHRVSQYQIVQVIFLRIITSARFVSELSLSRNTQFGSE